MIRPTSANKATTHLEANASSGAALLSPVISTTLVRYNESEADVSLAIRARSEAMVASSSYSRCAVARS